MVLTDALLVAAADPDPGIIPRWIIDLIVVIGALIGLPSIITWFLNRRGANRKLQVEESGADVSEFQALRTAYREDKAAAEKERDEARAETGAIRVELGEMHEEVDELRDALTRLRRLFSGVLRRNNYKMTPSEQREFEATKPRPRRPASAK